MWTLKIKEFPLFGLKLSTLVKIVYFSTLSRTFKCQSPTLWKVGFSSA